MPHLSVFSVLSMCAGCQRADKRGNATRHEFVTVEKALQGKMKTAVVHCEKHPLCKINAYCLVDKQAICAECVKDHPQGHEVDRLANVSPRFKEEISALVNKVSFLSFSSFSSFSGFNEWNLA